MKPFLRWAGGKRQIVKDLLEFLPDNIGELRYIEPFLGAGALFFALEPENSIISDANEHLVMTYDYVKRNPTRVSNYLRVHAKSHNVEHYYQIRDVYNDSRPSAAKAARFIYLNKTCYNGVFRVNMQNKFNVPYGNKPTPCIPSPEDLNAIGKLLEKADIRYQPYEDIAGYARRGDFVYLDPPYPPLNGTAYFTHYTKERFDEQDQRKLAMVFRELHERGCNLMMSNAETSLILDLYADFNIRLIPVTRYITCKSNRYIINEVVITNY